MFTGDNGEVTVDWIIVDVVTTFIFLGALKTRDGLWDNEIRRTIAIIGKTVVGGSITLYGKTGESILPQK